MLHIDPACTARDAAPTDPSAADRAAAARARLERQLQTLARLAEIGMEIAEAAGRCALAALDGEPVRDAASAEGQADRDPGLTYARVARAVRMTIALEARLAKDLAALDRDEALVQAARVNERRMCIHRLVERAIEAEHDDADAIDRLSDDAWENLKDQDEYSDIATRPIAETVARICKDLGLSPGETWATQADVTETGDAPHSPRPTGLESRRTPTPTGSGVHSLRVAPDPPRRIFPP